MHHIETISKTDLARRTRQVVDRARRGGTVIVESYGEEQVAIMDAIDYRILRAVTAYQSLPPRAAPVNNPDVEPSGLSETQVEYVIQKADGSAQMRWNYVLAAYLDGHISQGRAATLLGVSTYELDERFRRLDIPRRIGPETVKEAQADVLVALALGSELREDRA